MEDSEELRSTGEESQSLGIRLHIFKAEIKSLEDTIQKKKDQLNQNQNMQDELQDIINNCEAKNAALSKELSDIDAKILRAEKSSSHLDLDLRKRDDYSGIIEVYDFTMYLLTENVCINFFFSSAHSYFC